MTILDYTFGEEYSQSTTDLMLEVPFSSSVFPQRQLQSLMTHYVAVKWRRICKRRAEGMRNEGMTKLKNVYAKRQAFTLSELSVEIGTALGLHSFVILINSLLYFNMTSIFNYNA